MSMYQSPKVGRAVLFLSRALDALRVISSTVCVLPPSQRVVYVVLGSVSVPAIDQ
jgi:hypothetical protein